jgi:hypothetical protein
VAADRAQRSRAELSDLRDAPAAESGEAAALGAPGMDEVVRQVVKVLCREGLTAAATILNVTWSRELAARDAGAFAATPEAR